MKNKMVLACMFLLACPFSWGYHADDRAQKCVSKAEVVERVKQYMAEAEQRLGPSQGGIVDRAARTRLGVSMQQRLHAMAERNFAAWLKFQASCELPGVEPPAPEGR